MIMINGYPWIIHGFQQIIHGYPWIIHDISMDEPEGGGGGWGLNFDIVLFGGKFQGNFGELQGQSKIILNKFFIVF